MREAANRQVHRIAALTLAGALVAAGGSLGFELIAAPAAQAQANRSVQSGQLNWSIRDSFMKYIVGPVAQGEVQTTGGITLNNGVFSIPAGNSAITGASAGTISFNGGIRFYGHKGTLDLKLTNMKLVVNGTSGEIRVDYESRENTGVPGNVGPLFTGKDAVLATVAFSAAPDFTKDTVQLSGETKVSPEGASKIFADFYPAGEPLSPLNLSLKMGAGAGTGTGAATGAAPRSNATEGAARLLGQVNDTLIEVNGLIDNTEKLMDNSGQFYDRVWGAPTQAAAPSASGTAYTSEFATAATSGGGAGVTGGAAAPALPGAIASGGAPAANRAASTGQSASAWSAPAAQAVSNDICSAPSSKGVTSGDFAWGVRSTFRAYIQGQIAKGGWNLSNNVGYSDGQYRFKAQGGAVNPQTKEGSILFPGTIEFYGHKGILETRFSNIEVQFKGNSGLLVMDVTSNDVEGNPGDYGRVAMANLMFTSLNVSDSSVSGSATTSLTPVGAEAFANFYPAGDPLDPIDFTVNLSGAPNCAQGQGGASTGDAQGKSSPSDAAAALRAGAAPGAAATESTAQGLGDNSSLGGFQEKSGDGESQFHIKSSGASPSGMNLDGNSVPSVLALLASLMISGGSVINFGRKAPSI
ncbi:HtaA domain-containing protein [Corynebacterium sp. TA-R-1]|uniref:HtaA domain-containing protein n=1 Tax=Corynebacterium stercoris TaxID=2943490 RepID=A0ABT1G1X9_9CORY|nr:HtaA domain-containing protein [Corynebacterium stercoris]MCP1387695.1 HtaA domain-containing protein [Corynebacterium stercoris]